MSTLLRPPSDNPARSPMENALELRRLSEISPDLFTNMRPLWRPPGGRGVYGGAVIAQCLSAAQCTVPPQFYIHSMHCYFVLAGSPDIPLIYAVEHVREGRSFATRTVQARQRGRPIFTTTLSFVRDGSAGEMTLEHGVPLPPAPDPEPSADGEYQEQFKYSARGPFESQDYATAEAPDAAPHLFRSRHWFRTKGKISDVGGHQAHLSALAYMTDSAFIGVVTRAHKTWRRLPRREEAVDEADHEAMKSVVRTQNRDAEENIYGRPEVGMIVSLDHTIYFHRPREFRADAWLYCEGDSPWAGDGRGFVTQRIWTREGKLIATCFQEGLTRLKQTNESKL